jgi:protoporphyrinogen oxidase
VAPISLHPGGVTAVLAGGRLYRGEQFISTLAIRDLIEKLSPAPPAYLRQAVSDFHYRDFVTVALIVRGRDLFPDNWIYIHDARFKVGRIQNFNNWSPDLAPDPETTCLGFEYFCFENDGLWSRSDAELIDLARREAIDLGLAKPGAIEDGTVLRVPKAYPVYDADYQRGVAAMRRFLAEVPNLQLAGRNGMHRYNNQDHSMLTGILAARNILGGRYDLWKVNVDADYQEDGEESFGELSGTQPLVPRQTSGF